MCARSGARERGHVGERKVQWYDGDEGNRLGRARQRLVLGGEGGVEWWSVAAARLGERECVFV